MALIQYDTVPRNIKRNTLKTFGALCILHIRKIFEIFTKSLHVSSDAEIKRRNVINNNIKMYSIINLKAIELGYKIFTIVPDVLRVSRL